MSKKDPKKPEHRFSLRGDNGVLISAPNGDVIQFDDSGLVLKLSDVVMRDIADRLADFERGEVPLSETQDDSVGSSQQVSLIDADVLGDIDAWHVVQNGEWFLFQANLKNGNGPRGYRMPVSGGDIVADTPGAVLGVLSIGGPRRATGVEGIGCFPYHVVAPNDDIGAVGLVGTETAQVASGVSTLREQTRDSLIAEAVLRHRKTEHRGLPLIMARCEADQSTKPDELACGLAFDNFLVAADTLRAVAKSMNKTARILAIGLDYCLEDVTSTDTQYRDGMLALMRKIELALGEQGYRKPCFVSSFECGDLLSDLGCHTQAQWELATNPAGFDLLFSAPGYMFEQNSYSRPTPESLAQMAEMDAFAIEAKQESGLWCCPTFLLAERERDDNGQETHTIRVSANALSELVIDPEPDFGSVDHAGFSLENVENAARIVNVRPCPNVPLDILLECDMAPEGDNMKLRYACGQIAQREVPADHVDFPHNRGGIRDEWQAESASGRQLYRWALPCVLPVH